MSGNWIMVDTAIKDGDVESATAFESNMHDNMLFLALNESLDEAAAVYLSPESARDLGMFMLRWAHRKGA